MELKTQITTFLLFLLFLNVSNAVEETKTNTNPFSPRASLIRYWNNKIRNDIPESPFLLSKASPLNAVASASFSKLASSNSLGTHLPDFCASANLFCFPDPTKDFRNYHPDININYKKNYRASENGVNIATIPTKEAANKSGISVNKWVVEPGNFFREKMLNKGTVIPMPDIRDKMPKRSFLPRTITSKMPFSSSKIEDIKVIFHAADGSAMEKIIKDALAECERAPNAGETKRCVGSAEDMIDFSTSVLGRGIALRNTENAKGSKGDVMIGEVKGINGGIVTKSVSCHQILYPYLLYYCHSVPKVRVYEADLLDPISKAKINHGVAICHMDTSSWSPTHVAFLSLGSQPGRIEVCHWIFENEMTWTVAD